MSITHSIQLSPCIQDEFKFVKAKMALIYIDVVSGELLYIRSQRDVRTIKNHFIPYDPLKHRELVKTATIFVNARDQGII